MRKEKKKKEAKIELCQTRVFGGGAAAKASERKWDKRLRRVQEGVRMMRGRDQVYQSNCLAAAVDRLCVSALSFILLYDFSKRGTSHVSIVTPNIITSVLVVQLRYVKVSSLENYETRVPCQKVKSRPNCFQILNMQPL